MEPSSDFCSGTRTRKQQQKRKHSHEQQEEKQQGEEKPPAEPVLEATECTFPRDLISRGAISRSAKKANIDATMSTNRRSASLYASAMATSPGTDAVPSPPATCTTMGTSRSSSMMAAQFAQASTSSTASRNATQFQSSAISPHLSYDSLRNPRTAAASAALSANQEQTRLDMNLRANSNPHDPGSGTFSHSLAEQRRGRPEDSLQHALFSEQLRLQMYNNYLVQQQLLPPRPLPPHQFLPGQQHGVVGHGATADDSFSLQTSGAVPMPSTTASTYSASSTERTANLHVQQGIIPSTSTSPSTTAGKLTGIVANAAQQVDATEPAVGLQAQHLSLPRVLLLPTDAQVLSTYQCLLRGHIEAFEATAEDVKSHSRGRSKAITVGQVGIRCRHCKGATAKGSAYFPSSLLGLYQSAQNMALYHINAQDGSICKDMPINEREEFSTLMSCKSSVGGGKSYWASAGRSIGLVDTPNGIIFQGNN